MQCYRTVYDLELAMSNCKTMLALVRDPSKLTELRNFILALRHELSFGETSHGPSIPPKGVDTCTRYGEAGGPIYFVPGVNWK